MRALSGPMADTIYPLGKARIIVGRGTSCDIVHHEIYCSRVAFALEWESDNRTFSIRSVATHPVLVNDQVLGRNPVLLRPEDWVRVGVPFCNIGH
jgi:hypothetical protein